jgi:hypothetical protein
MGGMKHDDATKSDSGMKGDHKLKGCIRSSGGQYMLEEKKGKMVNLSSSQDLSGHVGHMVTLHGMWAGNASDKSSASSSSAGAEKTFTVTSMDMISETCTMAKDKHMGANGNGSMGTGTMGSGTTGSASSTGSSTQPQ